MILVKKLSQRLNRGSYSGRNAPKVIEGQYHRRIPHLRFSFLQLKREMQPETPFRFVCIFVAPKIIFSLSKMIFGAKRGGLKGFHEKKTSLSALQHTQKQKKIENLMSSPPHDEQIVWEKIQRRSKNRVVLSLQRTSFLFAEIFLPKRRSSERLRNRQMTKRKTSVLFSIPSLLIQTHAGLEFDHE